MFPSFAKEPHGDNMLCTASSDADIDIDMVTYLCFFHRWCELVLISGGVAKATPGLYFGWTVQHAGPWLHERDG